MTIEQIEDNVKRSGYAMVVFAGDFTNSPLEELPHSKGEIIRYAPHHIRGKDYTFSAGWYSTEYDYQEAIDDEGANILITTYDKFIRKNKSELRKAIRNSRW